MQPLFTIHAGEYLVGSHIEQHLRDPNGDKVNVWVPSKDTGIDLLVTDKTNKKTTSLQVKFSKDFLLTHGRPEYRDKLLSCGWWTLNREKIRESSADYWVFVLRQSGISLNTDLFPPVAGCYTGDANTNHRGAYGYCIV